MSSRPTDCDAIRRPQIGVKPIASGALSKAHHVRLERAADNVSPEARHLARYQVVVTWLKPAVDHQEHKERIGLWTFPQSAGERLRGPVLWVGPVAHEGLGPLSGGTVAPPSQRLMALGLGEEIPRPTPSAASVDALGQHRTRLSRE